MKKIVATVLAALIASPLCAEPLNGPQVKSLVGAGSLKFLAGSVGKFKADGSYSFQHGSKQQKGSYSINDNGVLTFMDGNTKHAFIIDKTPAGKLDVIYIEGPQKGAKYRLR